MIDQQKLMQWAQTFGDRNQPLNEAIAAGGQNDAENWQHWVNWQRDDPGVLDAALSGRRAYDPTRGMEYQTPYGQINLPTAPTARAWYDHPYGLTQDWTQLMGEDDRNAYNQLRGGMINGHYNQELAREMRQAQMSPDGGNYMPEWVINYLLNGGR